MPFNETAMMRCAALRSILDRLTDEDKRTLLALGRADTGGDIAATLVQDTEYACGPLREEITDLDAIALAGFRYAIGRMSTMPGICVEWLIANWNDLDARVRNPILSETEAAIAAGRAGMDCDVATWNRLLTHAGRSPVTAPAATATDF